VAAPKTTNDKTNDKAWSYGKLTVADIVDCAMGLIEREGVAKLTMRRLADELGMSSMITYYYVKSKNEMLDLVIERVWQEIPKPTPETGDWQERLRVASLRVREVLVKYPGLVQVIQTRPLTSGGRGYAEFADEMLLEAGMDEALVYAVSFALYHYAFGAIAWEVQARTSGAIDEDEMAARYAVGLDVVLEGMAVALAGSRFRSRSRQPKRRSTRKA
jgi:AcrR family transcriptional regulator